MLAKSSSGKGGINVRDEKEFKLWVKFIASIQRDGGDINKPLEILWESVKKEFESSDRRSRERDRIYQS